MNGMKYLFFLSFLLGILSSKSSFAAVNIGLSGSSSTSNFSLETHSSSAISANVAVGMGSYFHIGLTHRRSFENKSGLKKTKIDETTIAYIPFEDKTETVTNSIDLTIFLYDGPLAPFVFGGVARRDYITKIKYLNQQGRSSTTLFPVPNYGVGLTFRVSRQFRLKLSQTYTPGMQTVLENGVEKSKVVKDSYTQIGVTYQL